jgi:hypothetical protein
MNKLIQLQDLGNKDYQETPGNIKKSFSRDS